MKLKLLFLLLITINYLSATKIKELANVIGVRENQLIGYGLVVGLKGTGDGSSSKFTKRAISSMLQSVNVKIDSQDIKSKNVAAVIVTAKLPSFARQGDKLDIEVSSIGDAKSLQGGILLLTPLKAVDGEIYALAQGSITIGGYNDKGSKKINHATTAKVLGGAIVEREVVYDLSSRKYINLSLKKSDFNTAIKIEKALNQTFAQNLASAIDPRTIRLKRPSHMSMVEFLAKVNETKINYQETQKIVIDEKTGTIVAGVDITISPVIITHGDITLKIFPTTKLPKQNNQNSGYFDDSIYIQNSANVVNIKTDQVTVANITRVLHKLGAKPKDIITIMQTIKRAGAITAELEII